MGAALELARYDDGYWALPRFVDVGFLYYDTLDAGTPPFTWQEAYGIGRRANGLVYAGARGPELALHFLELAYSAGGSVLSEDGRASELDSPENLRALELMSRGVARGAVPRSVMRMNTGDARLAFAQGATVLRDWAFGFRALRRRALVVGRRDHGPARVRRPAGGSGAARPGRGRAPRTRRPSRRRSRSAEYPDRSRGGGARRQALPAADRAVGVLRWARR